MQKINVQNGVDLPGYIIFFAIVGLSLGKEKEKFSFSSLLIVEGYSNSQHRKFAVVLMADWKEKILNEDKRVAT
ncbi:hypothetical protein PO654_14140 [Phytobacter diazotrophicus]|uniref:hypothetical protein n=1 Tax=Phytobacter TaxID=447792 RepID=UPI000DF62211|nr:MULTISPECIES: hypothetical protein [Phytobacter]MDU4152667.1 hypothetical protein [Enterobacteriaceae bacterium]QIH64277.1 hypothetical protein CRX67_14945 [Enterobacteriaceae bacterium A-F18]MDU4354806.1 hypothetical protein [Phytobacter diazotrophicus]MDU4995002.1 hypothetical protein [Enterobacteriaceae bacterium]MDU7132895.1 hypothetical protein [Enterobacteriaceae bacterium]